MELFHYCVRIGVTGHRTLDNELELKKQIYKVLNTKIPALFENGLFTQRKRNTPELFNYTVLTSLAEGADRLVAETVIEYNSLSDIEIVMPLTLFDYKKTFKNPDDPLFINLFNKATSVKQLRKKNLESGSKNIKDLDELSIENNFDKALNKAFENAGRHVVNNCDVLIALWDGEKPRGIGGTCEIIEYAMSEERPIIIISTNPPYKINIMNPMK